MSELRKVRLGKADRNVAAWVVGVLPAASFLSVISIMELEQGTLLIERRDRAQGAVLRGWMEGHLLPAIAGRVLPVDTDVARRCAAPHVPNPAGERDALIAATGLVHGLTVVTRNIADFRSSGVSTINPWNADPKGGK